MAAFKLITPPASEPVTLDDAKAHARIDTDADDALVTSLITAARQWAEQYTSRALIAQTWQLWIDTWPIAAREWWDGLRQGPVTGLDGVNYIVLPRPPLIAVGSVQYFDDRDTATTWDAANYYVDTVSEPGRLTLHLGATWPAPTRPANGIKIEYTAGYGDDASDVPDIFKTAIMQLVSHWYENRGEAAIAAASIVPVPLVIRALLDPYRVRKI